MGDDSPVISSAYPVLVRPVFDKVRRSKNYSCLSNYPSFILSVFPQVNQSFKDVLVKNSVQESFGKVRGRLTTVPLWLRNVRWLKGDWDQGCVIGIHFDAFSCRWNHLFRGLPMILWCSWFGLPTCLWFHSMKAFFALSLPMIPKVMMCYTSLGRLIDWL